MQAAMVFGRIYKSKAVKGLRKMVPMTYVNFITAHENEGFMIIILGKKTKTKRDTFVIINKK